MEDILEGLNDEQKEAVTSTEGYVRVIAGAGTGKTRTLTRRFAYLVNEVGILPGNILCVTFTNKSAGEMKKRIHKLTGDNDTSYINTFHGFCVSVLREDIYAVSYPKNFMVLDNSDIDDILKIVYEERKLTLKDMTFSKARDMIEMQKLFWKPEYYLDMINMSSEALKKKYDDAVVVSDIIFYGYIYNEKKCFGLDYNDLIIYTLYIFRENVDVRLKWQKRLEYIMIDEFQDIDSLQFELMEVLSNYHKNLFVVGDPDQTIYTWRGANVKYLLDFDSKFPKTKTITMLKNYRSTPQILNAVNSLIDKNILRIKKDLVPVKEDGEMPTVFFAKDSGNESEYVTSEIIRLNTKESVKYSDIAVLVRSHYLTRPLEDKLIKAKIPYIIYSGVGFFDRAEIKDSLSYLRFILYRDNVDFRRIINRPKRNIGEKRMKRLEELADENNISLYSAQKLSLDDDLFKNTKAYEFVSLTEKYFNLYDKMSVSELFTKILDESGYEKMLRTEGSQERLDNLSELKSDMLEWEMTSGEETYLESYLSRTALYSDSDTVDDKKEKVKIMTVHAAKGLEFKNVFIIGMNEGIFPSSKTLSRVQLEEERRLCFVGMTRARERLYLTESMGKDYSGSVRYPSRFILDIDRNRYKPEGDYSEKLLDETKELIRDNEKYLPENIEKNIFEAGSRIRHPVMGEGTIVDIDMSKNAYIISFDGLETVRKISFKAKLELIE